MAITDAINHYYESLFLKDKDGSFCPQVCLVCDRIIKPIESTILSLEELYKYRNELKQTHWNAVLYNLAICYRYDSYLLNDKGDLE